MMRAKVGARMLCPECGAAVRLGMEPYAYRGIIPLGEFEAHICPQCGEASFTKKGTQAIERRARKFGLWGAKSTELLSVTHDPSKREVVVHYGLVG
jgi:predicted RNA-binding Zn-ribbon protein involved in translation (DUF1610 family)